MDLLALEFERPDGIASNAVALASMTDLLVALVLQGAPHNYSAAMHVRSAQQGQATAAPAYVRRAEAFMAAHAMEPIRMAAIAAAAGCSVRTLGDAFRRFRGKTTLQALYTIRLEQARSALERGEEDSSVAQVARRYGFSNAGRFKATYRQRFGQMPAETRRQRSR
ncbi:helix-turn-helix domain-containing protein [Elioraea rosea]|uniref:helix-turn-helix domain-containing protein n=1 Tax=Elioraea rosea TaxID=2492390 RepID=UPI001182D940